MLGGERLHPSQAASHSNGRGKRQASVPITNSSVQYAHDSRPYSTVSSVYSQPSPEMRSGPRLDIPRSSSIYPDDVSPPDSPRTTGNRSSSPNVSPISNAGSGFKGHMAAKATPTSIPAPIPQNKATHLSYISGWKDKVGAGFGGKDKKTKWDTYSGEPTGSEKGKPGSAPFGSTPFDGQHRMGNNTMVSSASSPKQSLFSNTFRKAPKKDPQPREEWKGASGRTAIIPPVQDAPNASGKSKPFPTPSQRRKQQGLRQAGGLRQAMAGRDSPAAGSESDRASSAQGKRSASATDHTRLTSTKHSSSRESLVSPFPPRLDSHFKISQDEDEPSPLSQFDHSFQDPETLSPPAIRDEGQGFTSHFVETPDRVGTPSHYAAKDSPQFSEAQIRNAVQHLDIHNEPGSRFSATTYNTTIPDSPPGTPDPSKEEDVPPVPVPGPSILNRKRPVPTSGVNFGSKPPSRKPTPSDIEGKSLPPAPENVEPVDRVTLLEAKLASLQKRRGANNTVIHELTQVVQPSSITYDIASRNEIKRTVEALTTENAAITKEIHETGLKLHRALKRRDESSPYEATGLWVRRVTE